MGQPKAVFCLMANAILGEAVKITERGQKIL